MSIIINSVSIEQDDKVITVKDDYNGGIDIIDRSDGDGDFVNIPEHMMNDFLDVVRRFNKPVDERY
jgi:hypothetical protein